MQTLTASVTARTAARTERRFFFIRASGYKKGGWGRSGPGPLAGGILPAGVTLLLFSAGRCRPGPAGPSGQRHGQIPDADDGAGLVLVVLGHSPALFSAGQFLLRGKGDLLRGLGLTVLAGLIGPGVILKNITIEILKRR